MLIRRRDVIGYEDFYEVSELGIIRSKRTGEPLKPYYNKFTGYFQVRLSKNGDTQTLSVHRIVARAFFGPPKDSQQVLHGPLGKTCNFVKNLKYGTASDNMQDWWDGSSTWKQLPYPEIQMTNELDCVCCGEMFDENQLDSDGICYVCNMEDDCPDCGEPELDCDCNAFYDDDFNDDEDYDEMESWEGQDYDDDDLY